MPSREPYIIHPFLMVRRQAIQKVDGYRYAFNSEDTDLYWRLLGAGRLHNLDAVLGEYRIHAHSVSSRSVLEGRIAAVSAQLAALSFRRVRAGRRDLVFPQSDLELYWTARTLAGILENASMPLDGDERLYLHLAVSLKLLEFMRFRSYLLKLDDALFVEACLRRRFSGLTLKEQVRVSFVQGTASLRLLNQGAWRELAALKTPVWAMAAAAALLSLPSTVGEIRSSYRKGVRPAGHAQRPAQAPGRV